VTSFWNSMSRATRTGFVLGLVVIAMLTGLAAWWTLRTDYQVLFSDLKPQDAQAMTSELDRLKTPYKLSDAGTAILVDGASVHATRLKLMGKDLPLHGAIGFELFNNTDFGMTEFAQKINYQRALQGEITRTIQSLAEVREVRVLLAMPEQGLFKQANAKAKASITIGLKQGQSLRANQVAGIQRLVAASVPGMTVQDVTIIDNQGVAMTRLATDPEGEATSGRLELKREMETYLSQKVTAVLDKAFGAGQALASVDVVLNMEQVKTTTEDVVPAAGRANGQSSGVMLREREVSREPSSPIEAKTAQGHMPRSGAVQREVDYAVGRRVEQVVTQPGSVRRLHVVAVVRTPLDGADEQRIRSLVAAAAGVVVERGDSVVVQSLGKAAVPAAAQLPATDAALAPPAAGTSAHPAQAGYPITLQILQVLVLVILAFGLGVWLLRRERAASADGQAAATRTPPRLTDQEREAALGKIEQWLHRDDAPAAHGPAKAQP
jgi:flagellar M-ring protein FliF